MYTQEQIQELLTEPRGLVDIHGRRIELAGKIIQGMAPRPPIILTNAIADNPRPRADGMPVVDGTAIRRGVMETIR